MRVDVGIHDGSRASPPINAPPLVELVSRLPRRLRERRFWQVQALVLLATLPHYIIEEVGYTNPTETLHDLATSLYVVPLLYAAITFGWEGAILTGLWAAMLTSPSMWLWHRSSYHWAAELGQLSIILPMGVLVAWRVELESKQRRRAEQNSASLGLLNEIGERLSRTLEVEEALPGVVRRLRQGLDVTALWLWLEPEPESPPGEPQVILDSAGTPPPPSTIEAVHRLAVATREPISVENGVVVVPLAGGSQVIGSLGAAIRSGAGLGDEQAKILATAAHEMRVAIENTRLSRQRQESLKSYARQVTQAQEEERLRIARELHDETAQELVHLVRMLERLGETAEEPAAGQVEELTRLARGTLQSVRRFSRDLRPSVLDDLGLLPAIELAVEETNTRLPAGARLSVSGRPRRLGLAAELALFRIAQESLHNVERHAQARSATVELRFAPDTVRLEIADDGQGCDLPENISDLARAGKLGILGMKERAELVGGSFDLRSLNGGGCKVTVEVAATS